ncbi:MAG: SEC-C metal-binding domain-containing protein, partial [Planctomycetota bacterium]
LRAGIGLRGYAQVDPKVEYRREASQMFQEMSHAIAESVTDGLLKVRITESVDDLLSGRWRAARAAQEAVDAFESEGDAAPVGSTPERLEPIRRDAPKVGRNDPCPCGSGLKYKKCHGRTSGNGSAGGRPGTARK